MIDFSQTLIRASAISKIMTEPKLKADKDAGELSQTAKTYLKELYIEKLWGLDKEMYNKYCDKGKLVEQDSITLISRLDKKIFVKNEESLKDDYFSGTPDVLEIGKEGEILFCVDAKSSWDAYSFIGKLNEPLDKVYESQMQIYLHLLKCQSGAIDYVLVDTPDSIIADEERRLLYQMGGLVATTESPEYLAAVEYLHLSSKYNHIPPKHRRIRFPVEYNPDFIEKCQEKVEKCREYLQNLHETHISLNK